MSLAMMHEFLQRNSSYKLNIIENNVDNDILSLHCIKCLYFYEYKIMFLLENINH